MVARQIRAYDGSGNPTFYYKDVGDTADGTSTNPDQSAVIIRPGGVVGQTANTPNKDGNILETLHYISNNLVKVPLNIAKTTTSVTNSLITIFDMGVMNYNTLILRMDNAGSAALNVLEIQGFESIAYPNDYQLIASTTANYTTGNGKQSGNSLIPVVDTTGTLPALPNNGKASILLNIRYYQRIRIQASTSSGTASISIAGTLK